MRLTLFLLLVVQQVNMLAQPMANSFKRSFPVISTYSKNFQDVFAHTVNQATLSGIKKSGIGLYSEKKFMLRDLHLFLVSLVIPRPSAGFGILMHIAGNKYYQERKLAFSMGKKMTDNLSLGIQFNYFSIGQAGMPGRHAINVEAGILLHLSDIIQVGFQIKNPVNRRAGNLFMPLVFSVATGYDCSDKVFLTAGIEKQQDLPPNISMALHYNVIPLLYLQCGLTTMENDFFMGVGLKRDKERLEIKAGYHRVLGFTPALSLIFPFGKKNKE